MRCCCDVSALHHSRGGALCSWSRLWDWHDVVLSGRGGWIPIACLSDEVDGGDFSYDRPASPFLDARRFPQGAVSPRVATTTCKSASAFTIYPHTAAHRLPGSSNGPSVGQDDNATVLRLRLARHMWLFEGNLSRPSKPRIKKASGEAPDWATTCGFLRLHAPRGLMCTNQLSRQPHWLQTVKYIYRDPRPNR